MDQRAVELARVLVDHSTRVKPGENVLITASDFTPMDLLRATHKLVLERGGTPELDVGSVQSQLGRSDIGGFLHAFLAHASEEQLSTLPPLTIEKIKWADKFIRISSVNNSHFLSSVDPKRLVLWEKTTAPLMEMLTKKDWVLTKYPTAGTAQLASMSLEEFEDFYYDACLVDYAAQGRRIQALQELMDAGKRVRIIAPGTDIVFGIDGRLAAGNPSGLHNIPDGECFVGPEEDVTEGHVTFEYPQIIHGNELQGIRLEFEKGEITRYSADVGGAYLRELLEAHPGNRRVGELGIGMNTQIQAYINNTLFDEKIAGTFHIALGRSYNYVRGGGKNGGTIHWDIVKELRTAGTSLQIDGAEVFRDGVFVG
jgi:aminopeptidase